MAFIELNNQSLKEWVEQTYQDILDKVDEINEDGFRIYNPITGEKDHVGNTVNDVYNALRVFAITCDEWDEWFLTRDHDGNDFRALNMSALEFDTKAWLLMYGFEYDNVISPVTGQETTIERAIEEVSTNSVITSPETNNLTCDQWDSLGFDQNDYEVNYITSAYQHDFQGIHLFDNQAIHTISRINGLFQREYTFGIKTNENRFIIQFDEKAVKFSQIKSINIVGVLPDTITAVALVELMYSLDSGYIQSIEIVPAVRGDDINELFVNIMIEEPNLRPTNISSTNPPKPIPLGIITASQWDTYFENHDGNDFKALNMSAYDYDTNSIYYILREEE